MKTQLLTYANSVHRATRSISLLAHALLEYPDGKLPFIAKNVMGSMETKYHSVWMGRHFVLLFFGRCWKFIWVFTFMKVMGNLPILAKIKGERLMGLTIHWSSQITILWHCVSIQCYIKTQWTYLENIVVYGGNGLSLWSERDKIGDQNG